jgi:hypothetical protein
MLFTLIKAITHLLPQLKIEGVAYLFVIIFISVCLGLRNVWKPSKIKIKIAQSDTIIEVIFGDLFEQNGIRVISVNNFFDSKIGRPVSDKSLHGIFLQKCFGGYPESFDHQINDQLKEIEGEQVEKVDGKTKRY